MSKKRMINKVVANAIVWAALILATSLITSGALDSDQSFMLLILQIAGWLATNGLVTSNGKAAKA